MGHHTTSPDPRLLATSPRRPASYRGAATQSSAPTDSTAPPPASPPLPTPAPATGRSNAVDLWTLRRQFKLVLPREGTLGFGAWSSVPQFAFAGVVRNWLRRALEIPHLNIIDLRKGGTRARPVLHFMVPSFGEAEDLVRQRHRLKAYHSSTGWRFVLMDVLSPEETILHRALYPTFLEAIRAGRKAQFSRAFLRIDGAPVQAPAC